MLARRGNDPTHYREKNYSSRVRNTFFLVSPRILLYAFIVVYQVIAQSPPFIILSCRYRIVHGNTPRNSSAAYFCDEIILALGKKRKEGVPKKKDSPDVPISSANFRGITIRRCDLPEARFTEARRSLVEFHLTFHGTTSPAVHEKEERERGRARGEPRAIVIKHRELAKLRCNLAGDVLLRGLARRGASGVALTYIHIHTCIHNVYVCMCVQGHAAS